MALTACQAREPAVATTPPPGYAFPALSARVVDAAHILPAADTARILRWSTMLEASTKHQFVVVTVPTLGGHDVADYTRVLDNYWGIGRKGYNDGIILLVAPNERKVRIAVGDGLRRAMSDDRAEHIIDADMLPSIQSGDLPTGVLMGASDITWDLLGAEKVTSWP